MATKKCDVLVKSKINATRSCNSSKNDLTCQRNKGHQGVHLSDETGKLVYWP